MFDRRHPLGWPFYLLLAMAKAYLAADRERKKRMTATCFCFGRPAVERCCNFPSHRERELIPRKA